MNDDTTKFLRLKDVAAIFGVTRETIDRWCRVSDFPYKAIPGGKRFVKADIDAWLTARSFGSHSQSPRAL
jgi:predicted DNA-binding transcriptional regulator AlpA